MNYEIKTRTISYLIKDEKCKNNKMKNKIITITNTQQYFLDDSNLQSNIFTCNRLSEYLIDVGDDLYTIVARISFQFFKGIKKTM